MVIIDQVSNETAARAYSQLGHGKIPKPIQRPDTYQRLPEDVQLNTCEQQPVHTLGSFRSFSAPASANDQGSIMSDRSMTAKRDEVAVDHVRGNGCFRRTFYNQEVQASSFKAML